MANVIVPGKYGDSEIVGYDGCWRREIYRPHEVPRERWNREVNESKMALNHSDVSPGHAIYGGYDSRCSCCYLNIPHTEALHASKVKP